MNRTWSLYDLETGLFTGKTFSVPDGAKDLNIPEGRGAAAGRFDHGSQQINLKTGEVEDYQPPAPSDEYEWIDRRWTLKPEIAEAKDKQRAALDAIAVLELKAGPRAVREALLLVLPEGEEKARLAEFDAEIAERREDLSAGKEAEVRQR